MSKLLSVVVFTLALSAQMLAQGPTVYISTASDHQILSVDGTSGNITILCSGDSTFVPEKLTFGPDGKLYVADTLHNRIFRLSPTVQVPPPACIGTGGIAEKIYDQSTTTGCADAAGNSLPCPSGPESPAFLSIASSLDLYFNTGGDLTGSNTGVWRIPGVAVKSAPFPAPVQVIASFASLEPACTGKKCPSPPPVGEGIVFDRFGNISAADNANNIILQAPAPAFTPTTLLTSSVSSPFGVAVDTCNNLLVANSGSVTHYSQTVSSQTGAITSTLLSDSLGTGNNHPKFIDVDAADNLFLITAKDETGSGAELWRIHLTTTGTSSRSDLSTSCVLPKSLSTSNLVVNLANCGTQCPAGFNGFNGLGVAVAPTNFAVTLNFPQSSSPVTELADFGHHSFSANCNLPIKAFNLKVIAAMTRPTEVTNSETNFASPFPLNCTSTSSCEPQPVGMHYAHYGAFDMQYLIEAFDPNNNSVILDTNLSNYCSNASTGPFIFKIGALTQDVFSTPGIAHASEQVDGTLVPMTPQSSSTCGAFTTFTCEGLVTNPLTDDVTHDVWFGGLPGIDFAVGTGGGNGGSKYVPFNEPLSLQPGITPVFTLKNPTLSGNPPFKPGNLKVQFTLTDQFGNTIQGALARLSILRICPTPLETQPVVSQNNSNVDNIFSFSTSSNLYTYNLNTKLLDLTQTSTTCSSNRTTSGAIFQFTIFSNDFPPTPAEGSVFNVFFVP